MQNHNLKPQAPQGPLEGGRLTEKHAWNYHKDLCEHQGRAPVELRLFKILIEEGKVPSKKVKNPFGSPPEFTRGLWARDVESFVSTLSLLQEESTPEEDGAAVFTEEEARAYLQKKAGNTVSSPRFRAYLDYFVIDAEWVEDGYLVEKKAVDAFLSEAPDGDHAARLKYRRIKQSGDLTVTEAYQKYAEGEPRPVEKEEFIYLAQLGIFPTACRRGPNDPFFRVPEQSVSEFLALRYRLYKKRNWQTQLPANLQTHPVDVSHLIASFGKSDEEIAQETKREAEEQGAPAVGEVLFDEEDFDAFLDEMDLSDLVMETETEIKEEEEDLVAKLESAIPLKDEVPESGDTTERLTIAEGYELYKSLTKTPLSYSWFRDHCADPKNTSYAREIYFPVVEIPEKTLKKQWLIRAEDVKRYVERNPKDRPRTVRRPCKVQNAYENYADVIPDTVTKKVFDAMVRGGSFELTGKDNDYLSKPAVRKFFEELRGTKKGLLPSAEAYALYCMKAPEPMSFTYFVDQAHQGLFDTRTNKSYKDERVRYVPAEGILRFLKQNPTGRRRGPKQPSQKTDMKNHNPKPTPAPPEVTEPSPPQEDESRGPVTLFMSHFQDKAELREFVAELSAKGVPVNLLP